MADKISSEAPPPSDPDVLIAKSVVGTLLCWFFLGEQITPLIVVGGVLIGLGILISSRE